METQEYNPIDKQLSLTIRQEYRLTVIKKVAKTTLRISWKTLLYAAFLTFANILV